MYSLYILISVLFFVTPAINGQTATFASFPSGKTTYDRFQQFISNLAATVDSNGARCVHSSGGAAGGIVSEGQGYGVFLGATTAIALGSSDSRYADTLEKAYQLFKGWKAMCKGSTVGNSCQASYLCPDVTVTPTAYYPCLPHWKFNDQLGNWEYGSATDGDIDGIVGGALLAAGTYNAKKSWYNEVAEWTYGSAKQFADYGCEEKTVAGVQETIVKLGSCWGGLSCTNPSYHSPGHYRIIRNWLQSYAAALGKPTTEINNYIAKYDRMIKSSYKIIISNQNAAGLTTNWYIPNQSDLSKAGAVNSACGGSGTPIDQYGAEAARGVWRVAVDFILYKSADSSTYLDKVAKQLSAKFNGNGFNGLDTGGFVTNIFNDWINNAFIYGPTFCALVDKISTLTNQDSALAKARDIISGGSVNDYYAGSWIVLSTLTLSGDLAKCASYVNGQTPGPTAPVAPVAPTKPPTAPVAPVAPVAPTKPPTAPVAPQAPSSKSCTIKGCSINMYYIEFATSTVGVTNAKVVCNDGRTFGCSVVTSGASGKYKCPITDNKGCIRPVPQLDGVKCPITIPDSGKNCNSVTTNDWWVEFVPPISPYSATLGSVLCSDGRIQSCVDGSGKLNCAIKENSCINPVPIYDGSYCAFPGTSLPAIISDANSLTPSDSLPVWGIALIITGCAVVVVVLVITVAVIRRRRLTQEIV